MTPFLELDGEADLQLTWAQFLLNVKGDGNEDRQVDLAEFKAHMSPFDYPILSLSQKSHGRHLGERA